MDGAGAHLVSWEFSTPRPWVDKDNPTRTQTFYITGAGDIEDYYSWVVATRSDVGSVGEINGTLYRITATATCPEDGEIIAVVVADVMLSEGETSIVSWSSNP